MKIEPNPHAGLILTPEIDWELMYLLAEEHTTFKLSIVEDGDGEQTFLLKPFLK